MIYIFQPVGEWLFNLTAQSYPQREWKSLLRFFFFRHAFLMIIDDAKDKFYLPFLTGLCEYRMLLLFYGLKKLRH